MMVQMFLNKSSGNETNTAKVTEEYQVFKRFSVAPTQIGVAFKPERTESTRDSRILGVICGIHERVFSTCDFLFCVVL